MNELWNRIAKRITISERGCWEWQGALTAHGYGVIRYNEQTLYVHRISYSTHIGPIHNLSVLHKCDNTKCCNPEHLLLGTAKDNLHDAISKGRFKSLTEADVLGIWDASVLNTESFEQIAQRYKCSDSTVYGIRHGLSWSWLIKLRRGVDPCAEQEEAGNMASTR